MNLFNLKNKYNGIEIIWIDNWDITLESILKNVKFDHAIRYDDFWTDFYNNPYPFSDFEDEEIFNYMIQNGKIVTESPLVWKFNSNFLLSNIIYGFINADRSIIAKLSNPINYAMISGIKEESDIIDFWTNNSLYFLTTLIDYSGLILISKDACEINKLAHILSSSFEKKQLRKSTQI